MRLRPHSARSIHKPMIAYLSGVPMIKSTFSAIVCAGVGYGVNLTAGSKMKIQNLPSVELFVYSHIKEDAIDLYGFLTEDEKILFLKLINVDGVGPKTALGIMDRGVSDIIKAVQAADVAFFTAVPRVGKKSAQKIIIELKGKLGGSELSLVEPEGKAKDVIDALLSLGFSDAESKKAIETLDLENMRVEDAVKQGIKKLTSEKTK